MILKTNYLGIRFSAESNKISNHLKNCIIFVNNRITCILNNYNASNMSLQVTLAHFSFANGIFVI